MKHRILTLTAALMLIGSMALAGSYSLVSVPAPGIWKPTGVDVGKITQVQVAGSTVASGTVILSSVSADYTVTNALVTVTCSNGVVTYDETNTVFIIAGDLLLRGGTATNGSCRIIVEQ